MLGQRRLRDVGRGRPGIPLESLHSVYARPLELPHSRWSPTKHGTRGVARTALRVARRRACTRRQSPSGDAGEWVEAAADSAHRRGWLPRARDAGHQRRCRGTRLLATPRTCRLQIGQRRAFHRPGARRARGRTTRPAGDRCRRSSRSSCPASTSAFMSSATAASPLKSWERGIDYRYSARQGGRTTLDRNRTCRLEFVERRASCYRTSMELPLSGIDLRRRPDGSMSALRSTRCRRTVTSRRTRVCRSVAHWPSC